MLFFRAISEEAKNIKDWLKAYEKESGQVLNFQNFNIFFGYNTLPNYKEEIYHLLEVQQTKNHKNYLGLPLTVGKNKKVVFYWNKA